MTKAKKALAVANAALSVASQVETEPMDGLLIAMSGVIITSILGNHTDELKFARAGTYVWIGMNIPQIEGLEVEFPKPSVETVR